MERAIDPLQTIDAKLWADEFMATKQRLGDAEFDHAMMLGWFANAIMRGYDEGKRLGAADAQATIEALQARVRELEESRDAWKASQECSEKAYMALVNQIPAERFDYDPINVALLDGAKEQEIIGRKQIAGRTRPQRADCEGGDCK